MGAQAQITGQIASVDSADNYCFFLPPMVGGDIAANEDKAIAFCNKPNTRAPGAKIFPPGFVLSTHWAQGPDWVQISGQIDPAQYSLNPCDTGGQYDIKAPVGATCAGFAHFVNVIEPEIGVYGMKCCQQKADCDVSHSTYGIKRIYGDKTDITGPRADGPLPLSLKCVNGALPAGVSTSAPSSGNATPTTASGSASTVPTTSSASTASQKTTEPEGKVESDSKAAPNAASGNNIMMAATAVMAAAAGLFMA
ncbi:hypothetical protein BC939DRAFT_402359 [Gamsiella multidivaricata]|uniref:uncharacterized protein n=1 Tax=Gamsiella multidivaricata TaxID=101098 RepID=UPI00221EA0EB|nr:uncharacterized protein BC939DRAFT_402359 [Gamsiella multidivaricata]KAI7817678.1 hypothetical protein BC939DRAFT_402359 [Gamsiella multidivaricata]